MDEQDGEFGKDENDVNKMVTLEEGMLLNAKMDM